ncbi:MAG: TetR/AcrR family transcriptional regulator [Myxococcales bacterium]|nr:TetR/AcrR family transcriptional regulator [Myxococcales bacterium]
MKSLPPLEWVRPALQARSQQTLERLLDAAESLVAEVGAERATVADITRAAGSSVGAFYARFGDKEGLLRCLFERFYAQAHATTAAVLAPERWRDISLAEALEHLLGFMLRVFRERRELIAAFGLRAARDPELAKLGAKLGQGIADGLHALLAARGEALDHPDPRAAVEIAVWLCLSALEARALYTPAAIRGLDEQTIATELGRVCLRYLGVGVRGAARAAPGAGPRQGERRPARPATGTRRAPGGDALAGAGAKG